MFTTRVRPLGGVTAPGGSPPTSPRKALGYLVAAEKLSGSKVRALTGVPVAHAGRN